MWTSGSDRRAGSQTSSFGVVFAIIGALLLVASPAALWLKLVAFDTDVWVERTAPLASDPELQESLADSVTYSVLDALDTEAHLDVLLDIPGLERLTPMLISTVETAVHDAVHAVARSDGFATVWRETTRASHAAFVASLTGREGTSVVIEPGTVVLDTEPLLDGLGTALESRGLGVVADLARRVEAERIVLLHSERLAAAGVWVARLEAAAYVLPVAAVLFLVAAFWIARDRWRIAQWTGVATALAALVSWRVFDAGVGSVASRIETFAKIPADLVLELVDLVAFDLVRAWQVLLIVGIFVVALATLGSLLRGGQTVDA